MSFQFFNVPLWIRNDLIRNPNGKAIGWFNIGHYALDFCFAWNEI